MPKPWPRRAGRQALRHAFFAERAAMGRGRTGDTDIDSAVVVGGGTMGAAIGYALAGIGGRLGGTGGDQRGGGGACKGERYSNAVSRGKMSHEAADAALADHHAFHASYDVLPPAQIAIEAMFEDLNVKRKVFAALDAALPEDAVLATNTSYVDPNRIAEGLRHPVCFVGMHFISPAHLMRLVEVIRARDTAPGTLEAVLCLTQRLKGALPWQIDAAMRGFGMAMGPYEVQDTFRASTSPTPTRAARLADEARLYPQSRDGPRLRLSAVAGGAEASCQAHWSRQDAAPDRDLRRRRSALLGPPHPPSPRRRDRAQPRRPAK